MRKWVQEEQHVISQDPPFDEVPTLPEIAAAVSALKNYKAAGVCGISSEMIKYGGQGGLKMLRLGCGLLMEGQCGFRKGRSCNDAISASRAYASLQAGQAMISTFASLTSAKPMTPLTGLLLGNFSAV